MNLTKRAALLGMAGILGAGAAQAQRTGGGTTSSSPQPGANADRTLGPEAAMGVGKYANFDQLMSQARTGNYLVGRVDIKGSELPWDYISVKVVCDGKEKLTTYADAKGNFTLEPPEKKTGTPDSGVATVSKATSATEFLGCQVHAVLPGYDSTTVTVANRDLRDNPDIGTVHLAKESGEGNGLSPTSASAPKDAVKALEKARKSWIDGNAEGAEKNLQKATQIYPQYAEAWYQLGKVQQQAKPQDAWASFSKAIEADPKFAQAYEHLSILAVQQNKWPELLEYTDKDLQLNQSASPQMWYLNAVANYKAGKKDVAEASAKKALAMDPLHTVPNTEQLLAVLLADKRDYAGALEHLKNLLTYMKPGPDQDVVKGQVAQLEKVVPQQKPQ